MNVVIYARYSSSAQREESIDGQVRVCKSFADANDMQVIDVYADRALSGKTDARPEFQRMIRDSRSGRFEAVLCYAVDRFARNRYDAATYKAKLKQNGVRLYYATSPMNDNPESILLESVMEGLAEYYSENLSRSIKRGLMENALEAKSIGGVIPLGLQLTGDRHFAIEPAGAAIVREIFDRYAAGESVLEITAALNARGMRTARGAPWTKNSLHSILTNTRYIGRYTYRDVVIEHAIPQVIPDDLFQEVQRRLRIVHAARAHNKGKKEEFLLTTKCFCGLCGAPMIGESGTGKQGATYYYYKCAARKRDRSCPKANEKKTPLETLVVEEVKARVLTDENIAHIAQRAAELMRKEAEDDSVLASLQAQLSDVSTSIRNLVRAMEMGILDADTRARMDELQAMKADLTAQISREQISKPLLTTDQIAFWLSRFKDGDVQNEAYRRRVIDALVNSVTVTDDGPHKTLTIVCNLAENNTFTVRVSDIEGDGVPLREYPNTVLLISRLCFGLILHYKTPA